LISVANTGGFAGIAHWFAAAPVEMRPAAATTTTAVTKEILRMLSLLLVDALQMSPLDR
jgi:hypothetical protein